MYSFGDDNRTVSSSAAFLDPSSRRGLAPEFKIGATLSPSRRKIQDSLDVQKKMNGNRTNGNRTNGNRTNSKRTYGNGTLNRRYLTHPASAITGCV
ncbi:hypothetical protein PUN28_018885 [Cardiocondyla obscurior]|uniref:Uncharacterized protein n=1 Tax=Cardiocondyla obscurior TaxID=286306 RepID=A0AAW2EEG6_9HYME